MKQPLTVGAVIVALSGCTLAQVASVQTYQDKIAEACAFAMPLAGIAGPVAPYIIGGCATETAIAKLALDPSSLTWIHGLVAKVRAR